MKHHSSILAYSQKDHTVQLEYLADEIAEAPTGEHSDGNDVDFCAIRETMRTVSQDAWSTAERASASSQGTGRSEIAVLVS